MHSAGWAVAWEFWGRNRIAMALTLAYLAIVMLAVNLAPAETFDQKTVIQMTIPLWGALALMIAVFSHGGEDVMSRTSGYPRRAFTLPLRTTALVTGPMVVGSVAVALLWLVLAGLVLRPGGVSAPLAWPAVFGMALVAWVQALMWCPFPLFALRAIVGILVIGSLAAGAAAGAYHEVSPILLLAVSAGLVPLGYGVAVTGLARARRGDGAVWHWPAWRRRAARGEFASAAAAQFWLEWQWHAWPMPGMIGGLLAAELLLFVSMPNSRFPELQAGSFVVSMILFPPVMAAAAGESLGNADARARGSMGPFSATRPLASADLLAVKLRVAVWIMLHTAALSVVLIAAMLLLTHVGPVLLRWTRALMDMEGIHGAALAVTGVLALALLIAKAMVDHLCIGLAGRPWLVVTTGGMVSLVLVAGGAFGGWVSSHPEWYDDLLASVPWAIGGVLVLKLALGTLVVRALWRRRLVAPRTLARFAVAWIGGAALLVGAALWLTPPDVYPPALVACAAVVLGLPTVRLGLAPLALDWNRHR